MANLLPVSEKKKTRKEYLLRLSIVALLLFATLVVISIVLLSPSFILSSFKYNSDYGQLIAEKKKISDETEGIDPTKVAKEVNIQLSVLDQKGSSLPLSHEAVAIVVGYKPDSVKIKSIFYDRGKEKGRISIIGVSKDRKTLLSFLKSLEGEKVFSKVELPISSFVEGENIEFSIRININKKNEGVSEKNNE